MHLKSRLWVLAVISALLIMLIVYIQPVAASKDNIQAHSLAETKNEKDNKELSLVERYVDPTNGEFYGRYTYTFKININPDKIKNISSLEATLIGYPPNGEFKIFEKTKTYDDVNSNQQITFEDINPRNELKRATGDNYKVFLGKIQVELFIGINGNKPIQLLAKSAMGPNITLNTIFRNEEIRNEETDTLYFCIDVVAPGKTKFHPYTGDNPKTNETYEWKTYPNDCMSKPKIGEPGTLRWNVNETDRGKGFKTEKEIIEG